LPSQIIRPGTPASDTVMSYLTNGNVQRITDPEGGVTQLQYTAAGHLERIEDHNHHLRRMEVDAKGQVRAMIDGLGRRTGASREERGRKRRI
jgi:YD repeat-containing protein